MVSTESDDSGEGGEVKLLNAEEVAGRVVLIDRGVIPLVEKVSVSFLC